jgi:hypothetical protein
VRVCCVTGFLHWAFKGASHEWHLGLPRSAVFYLPIISVSLPALSAASIRNRLLAISPYSRSHRSLHRLKTKRRKIPDAMFIFQVREHSEILFSSPVEGLLHRRV